MSAVFTRDVNVFHTSAPDQQLRLHRRDVHEHSEYLWGRACHLDHEGRICRQSE